MRLRRNRCSLLLNSMDSSNTVTATKHRAACQMQFAEAVLSVPCTECPADCSMHRIALMQLALAAAMPLTKVLPTMPAINPEFST